MTTLTETIRELRELLVKSTNGKWELEPAFGDVFIAPDYDIAAFDRVGDATLVVAMQNAIPALLDAAERYENALKKLACLGNGDRYGNSVGNVIAQEALAPQTDTAAPEGEKQ